MALGVDLSSHNHPGGAKIDYGSAANWLRAQGGTPFVIVKITESDSYVNPFWQADVVGFANVGCAVAGYIFDYGTTNPATEESYARGIVGPGLPLAVDAETPKGLTPAQYGAHIARVVAQEPMKVEYLNQSEVAAHELAAGDWLWLADYSGTMHYPCLIWQYSDAGRVPGIPGTSDVNRWESTDTQFSNFFHLGTIVQPANPGAPVTPNPPLVNCVGIAPTPTGKGYWLVQADGGVFNHGDAVFHGSLGNVKLAKPIVGMAAKPDGSGYWLAGSDGGVFSFNAGYYGSASGAPLAQPVVGIVSSPTGLGYTLIAADGGVFNYGDAVFEGSGA